MDRIVSQLVAALEREGVSASAASEAAAGNKSVIKNLIHRRGTGKNTHPIDNLLKIIEYYDFEVYIGRPRWDPSNHEIIEAARLAREFAKISFYPDMALAAGAGAFGDEHDATDVAFRVDWLSSKGLRPDHCVGVTARGDSMAPTIQDGDYILLDRDRRTIVDHQVYGIVLGGDDGGAAVKRLELTETHLILHSDNRAHKTVALDRSDADRVTIIGRVAWHGHSWTI